MSLEEEKPIDVDQIHWELGVLSGQVSLLLDRVPKETIDPELKQFLRPGVRQRWNYSIGLDPTFYLPVDLTVDADGIRITVSDPYNYPIFDRKLFYDKEARR